MSVSLAYDIIKKYGLQTNPDGTVPCRDVNGSLVFSDSSGRDVYFSEIARLEGLNEASGRASLLEADMLKSTGTATPTVESKYGKSGSTVQPTSEAGLGPLGRKFFDNVLGEEIPVRLQAQPPGPSTLRPREGLTPFQTVNLEKYNGDVITGC